MRIIEQSSEILEPRGYFLDSIYKDIERAARVSYKSEDRITEDSAKSFVERLIKNGHLSCLEHGTVYLKVPTLQQRSDYSDIAEGYSANPFSRVHTTINSSYDYITTNMRVVVENGWESDLQYLCAPTEQHEKRVSVKFITSIAMSRELNRHRCNSIIEQSTRYCNYSKDKFNNEVTFIKPVHLNIPTGQYTYWDGDWYDVENMKIQLPYDKYKDIDAFLHTLNQTDMQYNSLINAGWKPQKVRDILPLCTATELIHTAFVDDWYHLFELRCAPSAHPQIQALIKPLKEIFNNSNL